METKGEGYPTGDLGIVIYGSLLYKKDLDTLFKNGSDRAKPIKVTGYERIFDFEADRRPMDGERRAVLNLHQNDSWFNGILLPDVSIEEYCVYVRRETSYRFELVDNDMISFYDGYTVDEYPSEIVVSADARPSEGIKPIPSYLNNCLSGAKRWGHLFLDDFIKTTKVESGKSLDDYLCDW